MKKLNALKHSTQTQRKRLDDLRLQYQALKPESRRSHSGTQKKEEEEKVAYPRELRALAHLLLD